MSKLFEYYKILGVSAGAGIVDITSSYRSLCRIYHPDVSDDPNSEELMKRINIAYSALREKFGREAALRDRLSGVRTVRRYTAQSQRTAPVSEKDAAKEAFAALQGYFNAVSTRDYLGAYSFLSEYDKRHISQDAFNKWRRSVSRVYTMQDFSIKGSPTGATVAFSSGKKFAARKYRVDVAEKNLADDRIETGEIIKLVINENGAWRVFLGYKDIAEIAKTFDERFEAKRRSEIAKSWDEYREGLCLEYNMLSAKGMRKAVSRELYRQNRYGGALAIAAFAVRHVEGMPEETVEEALGAAAKVLSETLRETDIPAYLGGGVFAVLFYELRKRNMHAVINRVAERVSAAADPQNSGKIDVESKAEAYTGIVTQEDINKVLRKFDKKL